MKLVILLLNTAFATFGGNNNRIISGVVNKGNITVLAVMQMPNIQGHLSEIIGNQKPMGNRRISFQRFKNKSG